MSLRHICLALFVLTLAFMLPFELTVTRILGVACMVGFVVTGLFVIASPGNLSADEPEPEHDAP